MFQKNSFTVPSDSSGILLVKVIQTRRCSSTKHAKIGKFLKVVVKNTKTKLNRIKKKKSRAIIVRTNHPNFIKKGKYYQFFDSAIVLLKKRMNSRGKELFGPTSKLLKIKKFRIAYKCIF
jgi:ribosomal protein L14